MTRLDNNQIPSPLEGIRFSDQFSGADTGAQVNAAYASLPAPGGTIYVTASASFSTPIVFGTAGKYVKLIGLGGVVLTYTATGGTAITFNVRAGHATGWGMEGITLVGPSPTRAIGLVLGGTNGFEGASIKDCNFSNFNIGVQVAGNTFNIEFYSCMFHQCTTLWSHPALGSGGEGMHFIGCKFFDAPSPYTNAININPAGPADYHFIGCNFDQAQVIFTGGSVDSVLAFTECHFENPANDNAHPYDFVNVVNNATLSLAFSNCHFLNDNTSTGPSRFILGQGGFISLTNCRVEKNETVAAVQVPWLVETFNAVQVVCLGCVNINSAITNGTFVGGGGTGNVTQTDFSGNLSVSTLASSGGVLNVTSQTAINSSTNTSLGVSANSSIYCVRDTNNGGSAILLLDGSGSIQIVSQTGGTTFVTGAPAATQIQVLQTGGQLLMLAGSSRNGDGIRFWQTKLQ